jgi:hypothetical protein
MTFDFSEELNVIMTTVWADFQYVNSQHKKFSYGKIWVNLKRLGDVEVKEQER